MIEVHKNGLRAVTIAKGLALWEMDDESETKASHVVVDTAGSPSLAYEEIPLMIEFLTHVYDLRVTQGKRDLNTCPHCGLVLCGGDRP